MTAMELRISLLQEVSAILEDEKTVKKALASLRRIREKMASKEDEDREPTKAEILTGIREGLQAIKDRKEGKDVTGMFRDARELLNEL